MNTIQIHFHSMSITRRNYRYRNTHKEHTDTHTLTGACRRYLHGVNYLMHPRVCKWWYKHPVNNAAS